MNTTLCRKCEKRHELADYDAGSEREVERLCIPCFKMVQDNPFFEELVDSKTNLHDYTKWAVTQYHPVID